MPRVREPEAIRNSHEASLTSVLVGGAPDLPARYYAAVNSKSSAPPSSRSSEARRPSYRSRSCQTQGCELISSFGYPSSGKAIFCSTHASLGMVDVRHPPCRADGCPIQPMFGYPPTADARSYRREYCSQHRLEGMIDLAHGKFSGLSQKNIEHEGRPREVDATNQRSGSRGGQSEPGGGDDDNDDHDNDDHDNDDHGNDDHDHDGDNSITSKEGSDVGEDLSQLQQLQQQQGSHIQQRPSKRVRHATEPGDEETVNDGPLLQDGVTRRKSAGAILTERSSKAEPKAGSGSGRRVSAIGADSTGTVASSGRAKFVGPPANWAAAVAIRGCRTCHHQPCITTACFGFPGGKRTACGKHRLEGMVNLDRFNKSTGRDGKGSGEGGRGRGRELGGGSSVISGLAGGDVTAPVSGTSAESNGESKGGIFGDGKGERVSKGERDGIGIERVTLSALGRSVDQESKSSNSSSMRAGGKGPGGEVEAEVEGSDAIRTSRSGRPLGGMSARYRDYDCDLDNAELIKTDDAGDGPEAVDPARRASACQGNGASCPKSPSFGYAGGVREVCGDHRVEGMVNLVSMGKRKMAAARSNSGVVEPQSRPSVSGGKGCIGGGARAIRESGSPRQRTGGAKIRRRGGGAGGGATDASTLAVGAVSRGRPTTSSFVANGNGRPASSILRVRVRVGSAVGDRKKATAAPAGETAAATTTEQRALSVEETRAAGEGGGSDRPEGEEDLPFTASRSPTNNHALCLKDGCSTTARFGYPRDRRRRLCGLHKSPGMVNLNKRSRSVAVAGPAAVKGGVSTSEVGLECAPDETIRPSYSGRVSGGGEGGSGGGRALIVAVKPRVVATKKKTLRRSLERLATCAAPVFSEAAQNNLGRGGGGGVCEDDNTKPRAVGGVTKVAGVVPADTAAGETVAKKSPGSYKICREETCPLHASFGIKGGRREYCREHHKEGMVNLVVEAKWARRAAEAAAAAAAKAASSGTRARKPPQTGRIKQKQGPAGRPSREDSGRAAPCPPAAPSRMTRSPVWLGGGAFRTDGCGGLGARKEEKEVAKGKGKGKERAALGPCRASECDQDVSSSLHNRKGVVDVNDRSELGGSTGGSVNHEDEDERGGGSKSSGGGNGVGVGAKRVFVQSPKTDHPRIDKKPRGFRRVREAGVKEGEGVGDGDGGGGDGGAKERLRCAVCGRLPKLGEFQSPDLF